MEDLSCYKPVSLMPPVTRDLSIVLDNDMTDDDIGDIVRESLQENAEIVELVETLSQTPYQELPEAAQKRLGISPSQKNILLRVVLRALDRTLTTEECNQYRDQIYEALHKGTEWHWASHDRQNK
jgi:phenylalanyl-tRNA synthetase alpha chain